MVSNFDDYYLNGQMLDVTDIGELTNDPELGGFGDLGVAAALNALDGVYLTIEKPIGDLSGWFVSGVTPDGRRAVGQWPTAGNVIERLADGLEAAAEHEPDPERKGSIKSLAAALAGSAKDVATEVLTKVIERHAGLG